MSHNIDQRHASKMVDVSNEDPSTRLQQNHPINTEQVIQHHQVYGDTNTTVQQQMYSNPTVLQHSQTNCTEAIQQHCNNQVVHQEVDAPPQPANEALVCDFRYKTCESKNDLPAQFDGQATEKIHICNICHKGFTHKKYLQSHLFIHTVEKPYKCEECDRRFAFKSRLKRHSFIHAAQKPHVCKTCHRGFTQKSNLTKHYLTHTGEKNYICELCDKRFAQKINLRRHNLVHSKNLTGKLEKGNEIKDEKDQEDKIITSAFEPGVVAQDIPLTEVCQKKQGVCNQLVNYVQTVEDDGQITFEENSCSREHASNITEQPGCIENIESLDTIERHMVPQSLNFGARGCHLVERVGQLEVANRVPQVLRKIGHQTLNRVAYTPREGLAPLNVKLPPFHTLAARIGRPSFGLLGQQPNIIDEQQPKTHLMRFHNDSLFGKP